MYTRLQSDKDIPRSGGIVKVLTGFGIRYHIAGIIISKQIVDRSKLKIDVEAARKRSRGVPAIAWCHVSFAIGDPV